MRPHVASELPESQRGAQSTRRISLAEVERDPSKDMGQRVEALTRRNTTHLLPHFRGSHLFTRPIDELGESLRGACSFRCLMAS